MFSLETDLIGYMNAVKNEYLNPTQAYAGREDLPSLWKTRFDYIRKLDDIVFFNIQDQTQIAGDRGYVNSKDEGYDIIREISLPLVSYISAMKLTDNADRDYFYWKLSVDFDAIEAKENALVYTYGKKKDQNGLNPHRKGRIRKSATQESGRENTGNNFLKNAHFVHLRK